MEGEGLIDIFEGIGDAVKTVGSTAFQIITFPIEIVKGVVRIAQGENVLKTIGNVIQDRIMAELKLIAVPIRLIHTITDEIGIPQDIVDTALSSIPGPIGMIADASQVADAVESIAQIKIAMDEAEAEYKEFARLLNEEVTKLEEEAKKFKEQYDKDFTPTSIKASRKQINDFAVKWLKENYEDEFEKMSVFNRTKIPKKILDEMSLALQERFLNNENRLDIAGALYGPERQLQMLQEAADQYLEMSINGIKNKKSNMTGSRVIKDVNEEAGKKADIEGVIWNYNNLLEKSEKFILSTIPIKGSETIRNKLRMKRRKNVSDARKKLEKLI
jgi:hypothetical protein